MAACDRRAAESVGRYAASLSAGVRVSVASLRTDLESAKAERRGCLPTQMEVASGDIELDEIVRRLQVYAPTN
ncbi:MAG: hypothetical protein ABSA14_12955 [Acidimicrobiales bacterium]